MGDVNDSSMGHGPLQEHGVQQFRRLRLITRVTQLSGQTTYWRSENVSEGGIFVRAAPTLPPGTQLEIGFFLPEDPTEIVVQVEVVWTNDANSADFDQSKPYGMGMRFVDLDPAYGQKIRDYVGDELPGKTGG